MLHTQSGASELSSSKEKKKNVFTILLCISLLILPQFSRMMAMSEQLVLMACSSTNLMRIVTRTSANEQGCCMHHPLKYLKS